MCKIRVNNNLFFLLVFSFLLSGCATPTPVVVEITRIVPQTVVVTQLATVIITTTPIPPTTTPEVTPTPNFLIWKNSQVVDAFKSAGLECESPSPMTKADYGAAPDVAIEGTHFLVPSVCSDCGGRIMSFSSAEDLQLTKAYYDNLGKVSTAFFSWVFVRDNILVQINGDLPETSAHKYEAALLNLT
jgi:hypothetical protein